MSHPRIPVQVISSASTEFYDFTTAPAIGDILDLGYERHLRVYARAIKHDLNLGDLVTIKVTDA